jgi:hypothetical protein
MEGGFKSPLKLNAGLGQLDQWNEDAIKAIKNCWFSPRRFVLTSRMNNDEQ